MAVACAGFPAGFAARARLCAEAPDTPMNRKASAVTVLSMRWAISPPHVPSFKSYILTIPVSIPRVPIPRVPGVGVTRMKQSCGMPILKRGVAHPFSSSRLEVPHAFSGYPLGLLSNLGWGVVGLQLAGGSIARVQAVSRRLRGHASLQHHCAGRLSQRSLHRYLRRGMPPAADSD